MAEQSVISWAFAAACLLYLAGMGTYLSVRRRTDELPPAANFILGLLCAVAVGFCAFFFSGTLGLNFKIPEVNVSGSAAGGMGVFVFVLLLWFRAAPRHISISVNADASLEAINRILRDLEHVWKGVGLIEDGHDRKPSISHEVQGKGQDAKIVFSERGRTSPVQTLTAEEVQERLSEPERQLLLDTEQAMSKKLTAWRRAYAEISDPAAANIDQKKKLLRIAAGMSDDLEAIFGAIERTLNGELQDHYSAERWIASRAAGLLHQLELEESGPLEREFGD